MNLNVRTGMDGFQVRNLEDSQMPNAQLMHTAHAPITTLNSRVSSRVGLVLIITNKLEAMEDEEMLPMPETSTSVR